MEQDTATNRTFEDMYETLVGQSDDDLARETQDIEHVSPNWNEALRGGRLYVRCVTSTCRRTAIVLHRDRMRGEEASGAGYKWGWVFVECENCRRIRASMMAKWTAERSTEEWIKREKTESIPDFEAIMAKCLRDGGGYVDGVPGLLDQKELFRDVGTGLTMRSIRFVDRESGGKAIEILGYVDMDFL